MHFPQLCYSFCIKMKSFSYHRGKRACRHCPYKQPIDVAKLDFLHVTNDNWCFLTSDNFWFFRVFFTFSDHKWSLVFALFWWYLRMSLVSRHPVCISRRPAAAFFKFFSGSQAWFPGSQLPDWQEFSLSIYFSRHFVLFSNFLLLARLHMKLLTLPVSRNNLWLVWIIDKMHDFMAFILVWNDWHHHMKDNDHFF